MQLVRVVMYCGSYAGVLLCHGGWVWSLSGVGSWLCTHVGMCVGVERQQTGPHYEKVVCSGETGPLTVMYE